MNLAHQASIQLPFVKPQNLYVCPLNEDGTLLFLSNYPLDGADFMADQTVLVFNARERVIVHAQ
jgi:hypothetical protein